MALRLDLRSLIFACALLCCSSDLLAEGPWPQWQGPQRDAVSTEAGLIQEFPEGGPQRLWLFEDCGIGYSGPAIVENKLYILGAFEGTDHLLCLDATTGEQLWKSPLGSTFENDWGNGPRSTPTVDGDFMYVLTPTGTLYCLQTDDGSIVWQKEMQDLGGEIPVWGYSESPLVLGNTVFCTPGGEEGAIAAFDKISGDLLWQSKDYVDVAHYSSIMPMKHDGRTILVQLLYKELVGVDPENGGGLWSIPWNGNVAVIPTPIISHDTVYATSGYGAGCVLVRLSGNDAEVVYENKNMTNHHGGVILRDGHLFGYSDGKGWVCQDHETGKLVWREREALGKGAIAYADGRFYCLGEDEGELVLITASADGWEEHGRFTLEPQTELRKPKGKIWTHPVIANGKLYLRDQELLFCFDVKGE
ncbi:PQQ-binding-like beta-propeller repeat protein [Bythopirellula polymerisocia]|uniref:Outer membrane biogenesis protein BamB n=1 Tax=Bythopirellula polymerisocia TaxID=2528003 RepID=A0A5C6C8L4_9BACT|nr:PQQ-binding-like beta-propeller repeat protein [Bythopirellula polymerisocia]TWU20900.1 outer membrane biogenesis protein BamB [Bythopirellula polymerisocia]